MGDGVSRDCVSESCGCAARKGQGDAEKRIAELEDRIAFATYELPDRGRMEQRIAELERENAALCAAILAADEYVLRLRQVIYSGYEGVCEKAMGELNEYGSKWCSARRSAHVAMVRNVAGEEKRREVLR